MSTEEIILAVERRLNEKYIMVEKTFDLRDRPTTKSTAFIENIISYVCKYFNTTRSILLSRSVCRRPRTAWKVSEMRFMVFRLCRELPEEPISYHEIGGTFGRTHATVMNGEMVCIDMCKLDKQFSYDYEQIKAEINTSLKK